MEITIERARPGDAEVLASIQISSWLAAFADILDQDDLKKCTDRLSVTQMYEKLLERSIGYGYLLRIDQKPHAIAWWDRGSSPNQFACAELVVHPFFAGSLAPGIWQCLDGTCAS